MNQTLKTIGSQLYKATERMHRFLYDWEFLDSIKLKTPVVSIGNLTTGGSGKTPFVDFLAKYYREQNARVAIVSRNYKAEIKTTARIDIRHPKGGSFYGDEAFWLASQNPDVPVYVGPKKWESALLAESEQRPDLILVDDGFQHRALHRNLDMVLLDASARWEDYAQLPLGRAREPWQALERASWIVLSKVNMTDELSVEEFRRRLPTNIPVVDISYELEGPFLEEAGKKALAFAGLARPESFKESLQRDAFYELVDFVSFADHYAYDKKDYESLLEKMRSLGAELLLTTEKDYTKLKQFDQQTLIRALPLKLHIRGETEKFYADLNKSIVFHS